jgi:hypothetical protein
MYVFFVKKVKILLVIVSYSIVLIVIDSVYLLCVQRI